MLILLAAFSLSCSTYRYGRRCYFMVFCRPIHGDSPESRFWQARLRDMKYKALIREEIGDGLEEDGLAVQEIPPDNHYKLADESGRGYETSMRREQNIWLGHA